MAKKVVEEKIQITQNTPDIVQAVSVAATLTEIFKYPIPDNSEIILEPTDFIAMYLYGAAAEIAAKSRVVVAVTDPYGRRERVIADAEYQQFKEFQDSLKKYYVGTRVIIPANFLLKVKANTDIVTVVASTRHTFSAKLVYETLD